jgi:hypothetical protein
MIILADYNVNRQALIISGSLAVSGFLDLIPIRITTFAEVGLAENSSDRAVWQFIQQNKILLLTANRNAQGEDSLEQVMRKENQPTSLPIVTISDPKRVNELGYRERCVERLVEIVIDLQDYLGTGRLFIP